MKQSLVLTHVTRYYDPDMCLEREILDFLERNKDARVFRFENPNHPDYVQMGEAFESWGGEIKKEEHIMKILEASDRIYLGGGNFYVCHYKTFKDFIGYKPIFSKKLELVIAGNLIYHSSITVEQGWESMSGNNFFEYGHLLLREEGFPEFKKEGELFTTQKDQVKVIVAKNSILVERLQ